MTQLPEREFFETHADLCHTFSNANRLRILDLLREGEQTVSDLTEASDLPQPTISQHLKVMRETDIVTRRKDGVESYYSITDERVYSAVDLMRELMLERMDE